MGTITSATAWHSADERKRRSDGLFSESVNYLAGYMALLRFSFLSPTFPFCFASHLRNIIWFEIQHFPLCHVLGSAAHALCRSLISIHSLLKCSSIHLEKMLRHALRVERMLLNECWQRRPPQQQNPLYRKRLQTVSHCFYCSLTHILFSHFRSHIKPNTCCLALNRHIGARSMSLTHSHLINVCLVAVYWSFWPARLTRTYSFGYLGLLL